MKTLKKPYVSYAFLIRECNGIGVCFITPLDSLTRRVYLEHSHWHVENQDGKGIICESEIEAQSHAFVNTMGITLAKDQPELFKKLSEFLNGYYPIELEIEKWRELNKIYKQKGVGGTEL